MTREGLRKHLREEHLIKSNLRTFLDGKNHKLIQSWWGEEEWKQIEEEEKLVLFVKENYLNIVEEVEKEKG